MAEANPIGATFENVINKEFEALGEDASTSQLNNFFKNCDAVIQTMRSLARTDNVNGIQQPIENYIECVIDQQTVAKRKLFAVEGLEPKGDIYFQEIDSAFRGRVSTGLVTNLKYLDPEKFIDASKNKLVKYMQYVINEQKSVKASAVFSGIFALDDRRKEKLFTNEYCDLWMTSDLNNWYDEKVKYSCLRSIEEFTEQESGWALVEVNNIAIKVCKYNPMRAGSYIDLPRWIKTKCAVVNVKVFTDDCFAWAIISALFPATRRADRRTSYPDYKHHLNFDGISFPVAIKDIRKFERQNDISVNVFELEERRVSPVHLTRNERKRHVNLLYLTYEKVSHYCWFKHLGRVLGVQCSKTDGKKYFCNSCLHHFMSQKKLDLHKPMCTKMGDCAIQLPEPSKNLFRFTNFAKKIPVPFVLYTELMCLSAKEPTNFLSKPPHRHRQVYNIGYYLHCRHDRSLSRYRSYRGSDCTSWFGKELKSIAVEVNKVLLDAKPTAEFKDNWRPFHITYNIPVIFHNVLDSDVNFLFSGVLDSFGGEFKIVPESTNNYINIVKFVYDTKARFSVSSLFRFLNIPFEELASSLNDKQKKFLKSQFPIDKEFKLLTHKGIFPHDFIKEESVLEQENLPSHEYFSCEYNKMYGRLVSTAEYKHALKLWDTFECKSLGDYADLHLKTHILLLADVFQHVRDTLIKSHDLDPAHYFSLAEYSYECALRHTRTELDLITDIDMLNFIERGTRGGLSQCSNRYAKANNKYMPDHDPSKPSKYLMCFDTDLYNWALCQPLPTGNFEWVTDIKVEDVPDDSEQGYIFEVDLTYPSTMHETHKDFPLCPELVVPSGAKEPKLMATLNNKSYYIIHYRNLKQALAHGVTINKIHRILKFTQSPWLKSYVDCNMAFRDESKQKFKKHLYKSMNGALFDKIMENVRSRMCAYGKRKWEKRYGVEDFISKPYFHDVVAYNETLCIMHMKKTLITVDRPIYIGMCLMDLARSLLYSFHYDYILPTFEGKSKLLYTDSSYLIYELQCEDIYDRMKRDIDRFDTSNYPEENAYEMPLENNDLLGLMKDKYCGKIITEFAGLRSKMYAVRVMGESDEQNSTIFKQQAADKTIRFDHYLDTLGSTCEKIHRQKCVTPVCDCQTKMVLNPHDDKRVLVTNSTDTLPWGHKFTKAFIEEYDADMDVNT